MSTPGFFPPGHGERGMILINVLVIVMFATTVLALMLASAETDVDRSVRLRAAAQALAIAKGGELSAIAALRRDLAETRSGDTLAEPWANIADRDAVIAGGRFTFAVTDAQARFNINTLIRGDANSQAQFRAIVAAAGLPQDNADLIAELVRFTGGIGDLADMQALGLDRAALRRLAVFCTVLPTPTAVNVNTASEQLLAILLGNPAAARTLVGLRSGTSRLDGNGVLSSGILLPPGTGYSSDYFWTRARVTMGETSQQLTSLLHRRMHDGQPEVVAVRRWRGAAPIQAPPLDYE